MAERELSKAERNKFLRELHKAFQTGDAKIVVGAPPMEPSEETKQWKDAFADLYKRLVDEGYKIRKIQVDDFGGFRSVTVKMWSGLLCKNFDAVDDEIRTKDDLQTALDYVESWVRKGYRATKKRA